MPEPKRILVTGATGKVGQAFIQRILDEPGYDSMTIRALCHNRMLEPRDRLEVVRGSIEHQDVIEAVMQDVTHVLHLATSKETPETIMDVAVKGMFWLLEASRTSDQFEQFLIVGGDASIGLFAYPHLLPVTEQQKHSAYQGCYALSKVLEEVMLEQYYIQYDLNGCCLRAPWIMEKDDLKYTLAFGDDQFGGPRWRDLMSAEQDYIGTNTIPVLLDTQGGGVRRNFVHISDLVDAIIKAIDNPNARQQTFNICMDEPLDYEKMGAHLARTRGYVITRIPSDFYSSWMDNSKAKFLLGWQPVYDAEGLIDSAFEYQRDPSDPRVIWYPG